MRQSRHHRLIFFTIKSNENGNNLFYETLLRRVRVKTKFSNCRIFRLGLPFSAFVEAFFLLSQRKYPTAHSLLDSVSQLVNECVRNLNSCLQAPSSTLIQQSNQYLLHRATRINSSTNPSVLNNRSSIIALRSTTSGTNRASMASSSAPTPRTHPTVPSATAVTTSTSTATNNSDEKSKPSSAKSVFPLFFDVL